MLPNFEKKIFILTLVLAFNIVIVSSLKSISFCSVLFSRLQYRIVKKKVNIRYCKAVPPFLINKYIDDEYSLCT